MQKPLPVPAAWRGPFYARPHGAGSAARGWNVRQNCAKIIQTPQAICRAGRRAKRGRLHAGRKRHRAAQALRHVYAVFCRLYGLFLVLCALSDAARVQQAGAGCDFFRHGGGKPCGAHPLRPSGRPCAFAEKNCAGRQPDLRPVGAAASSGHRFAGCSPAGSGARQLF